MSTIINWSIVDFQKQWLNAHSKACSLISEPFPLSSKLFATIRFKTKKATWWKNQIRIKFESNEEGAVEVNLMVWLENEKKERFGNARVKSLVSTQNSVLLQLFNKESIQNILSLNDCFQNRETFQICCEVLELKKSNKGQWSKLWSMFEEGKYDAVLVVGKERIEFKVFKFFFMTQSPVFKRLFEEASFKGGKTVLEINDINANTMDALVKWLYTGQFEDGNSIEGLYEVALKYDFALLKDLCLNHLITTLNKENVLSRLIFALQHNDSQLESKALDQIRGMSVAEIRQMVCSKKWKEFCKKNPTFIKQISSLIF